MAAIKVGLENNKAHRLVWKIASILPLFFLSPSHPCKLRKSSLSGCERLENTAATFPTAAWNNGTSEKISVPLGISWRAKVPYPLPLVSLTSKNGRI